MTNLIKSHSFIVRKANGIDDFRVQLRAGYWNSIKSSKKLLEVLDRSIARFEDTQPEYGKALRNKFNNRDFLDIMRIFGMIGGSERLTKNEEKIKFNQS